MTRVRQAATETERNPLEDFTNMIGDIASANGAEEWSDEQVEQAMFDIYDGVMMCCRDIIPCWFFFTGMQRVRCKGLGAKGVVKIICQFTTHQPRVLKKN